jgi:hypothetical protein
MKKKSTIGPSMGVPGEPTNPADTLRTGKVPMRTFPTTIICRPTGRLVQCCPDMEGPMEDKDEMPELGDED